MGFTLCCLGSPGALLFDHNRLLALQNSTGTTQGSLGKQMDSNYDPDSCEIQTTNKKRSIIQTNVVTTFEIFLCKITNEAHHAQVLPVIVLANDVPQAVEGGAGVLVDGDLLIRVDRFVLTCATRKHILMQLHLSAVCFLSSQFSAYYLIQGISECKNKSI